MRLRCAAAREDGNAVTRGRKSCRSGLAADAMQKTNATLEINLATYQIQIIPALILTPSCMANFRNSRLSPRGFKPRRVHPPSAPRISTRPGDTQTPISTPLEFSESYFLQSFACLCLQCSSPLHRAEGQNIYVVHLDEWVVVVQARAKYDCISKQPRRMATGELRCKIFGSTTPPSRPGRTHSYGVALPLLMLFGLPRHIVTAGPGPRLLPEGPCLKDFRLELRPGCHATIASLIYTSLFPLIVLPLDSYSATAICVFVHSLQATGSG
jgi:hypothetical protein